MTVDAAPRRIHLYRPHNQLGDLLLNVPAIRAVRERYPDARITLVASPERRGYAAAINRGVAVHPDRDVVILHSDAIVATHAGFESDDFFDVWPSVPAPTVLIHGGDSPVRGGWWAQCRPPPPASSASRRAPRSSQSADCANCANCAN